MSVYSLRALRQEATDDAQGGASPIDALHNVDRTAAASTSIPSRPAEWSPTSPPSPSSIPLTPTPAAEWATSLQAFARTDVTIFLYFFLILLLYFGGSANPLQYLHRLHVLVVDLDSPATSTPALRLTMGQTLESLLTALTGDHLTFEVHDATAYASIDAAIDAAYAAPTHSEYWASILLRPNATAQWDADVQAALSGGIVTAPASSNVLFIVETARNSFLYGNYILSQVNPLLGESAGMFEVEAGHRLLTLLSAQSNVTQSIAAFLSQPPPVQSYMLSPMQSATIDVAPAQPFIATVATTLGLFIQWIFCAAVVGTTIGDSARLVRTFNVWQVMGLRVGNTLAMTLALSGIFVGMVAWWADGAFDGSVIGVYWMFAWLYMSTFCMFTVMFSLNLGVLADLTGVLFLFLNVISSTSQLPTEMQQTFYTIGVGLPLYNAIVGSRRLLMDGRQEGVGVNVGVLLVWLVGCSLINLAVDARRMHRMKQAQGASPTQTPPLSPEHQRA